MLTASWRASQAALVINEVLYDPEGADAGREFVEIMNNGPFAAPIEGLSLEAGDGARANAWKRVWIGQPGVAIPPGGIYRVGLDAPGSGEPALLDLQNGPDGVRLMKWGFELDRLGWGNLAQPEYYEGDPAPAVRFGHSLARSEDGVDTDDNASDFSDAVPTPGRLNRPIVDWALRIVSIDPVRPRPGDRIVVRIREQNRGTREASAPSVGLDDGVREILIGWDETIAPDGVVEEPILVDLPADSGRIVIRARILSQDSIPENDADSVAVRVGVGPVRITEILASPQTGGSEWVEVRSNRPAGATLDGYDLLVRGKAIRLHPPEVSESTRVGLVVEDSLWMRQRYPHLPPCALWPYEGSWPHIRDGQKSGGISDSIRIRASDGTIEEIALPGAAPAPGVSLERIDADLPEGPSAWLPCGDPSGSTPGRIAGSSGWIPGARPLSVNPRIVYPGSNGIVIEGSLGNEPGEVRLTLLDLNGREVRCLMRDIWAVGAVSASWDGRDESGVAVTPGIYVALLEISRKGTGIERRRAGLAVAPRMEP